MTGPVCYGIDVYENNILYVDSTVKFVILKAYESGFREDSKFAARWPLVKSMGRWRGAYLFGHPGLSASSSISTFCSILKNNGFDLHNDRAFLDHEVTDGKSPSYCASWAQEVCAGIDATMGASVTGLYTYQEFIRQGCCAGLGKYPLWLAKPSTPVSPMAPISIPGSPWTTPALCQYAVYTIDWDYFAGDDMALASWWTSAAPVQPPTPVPPPQPAPVNWSMWPPGVTLQEGSTGDAVRVLQSACRLSGIPGVRGIAVDGDFGPQTLTAVRNFQAASGLAVDGIAGPATRAALEALGDVPGAPPPPPAATVTWAMWPASVTLQRGSSGAAVRVLQTACRNSGIHGVRGITVDGLFGDQTYLATRNFQAYSRLIVDGIAGPQTRSALEALGDVPK